MEIIISFNITKIEVKTTILDKPIGNIVAFVELHYIHKSEGEERILFKVKGSTIKIKQFGNGAPFYKIDAPAHPTKKGPRCSFYVDDKKIWRQIESKIIQEFNEKNGGVSAKDYIKHLIEKNEEVNPNEIPI